MKQYCRYCAWLTCGDANWCEKKEKCLKDSTIQSVNKCKHFAFVDIDALNLTSTYQPRLKEKAKEKVKQTTIYDFIGESRR